MAFTTVPEVTTSEEWSAANHNTYVKANFEASPPVIFNAAGDLFIGEGADTGGILTMIPGQILTVDTTETLGVKWSSTSIFNFVGTKYTNADYDGDTFGEGTIAITLTDATGYAIPAGNKFLLTLLKVYWNAGTTTDYVYITSSDFDSGEQMVRVDYYKNSIWTSNSGLVFPSANAIQVVISSGCDINLNLWFAGYFGS